MLSRGRALRISICRARKTTKIFEESDFTLRADAFDILNHPNFGQPSGNVQSSTFGQITATRFATATAALRGSSRSAESLRSNRLLHSGACVSRAISRRAYAFPIYDKCIQEEIKSDAPPHFYPNTSPGCRRISGRRQEQRHWTRRKATSNAAATCRSCRSFKPDGRRALCSPRRSCR